MIEIDGSYGEGGGQIIRSSLSLSALTGTPATIENIRAGRSKPGLMRQHLTAIRALATICSAEVEGAELKSSRLIFAPGKIQAGDYEFEIGTAGSTTLVAQTLLPALMFCDAPSSLRLHGGTHNPWCPPFEYLENVFLKQLRRMGGKVVSKIQSHGFYPAGGGEIHIEIDPIDRLRGIVLTAPIDSWNPRVTAIVSALPESIGQRECKLIQRRTGWNERCFHVQNVDQPHGPGNAVMIELESDHVSELFIELGRVGVKAERVARAALKSARAFISSRVPVGEYLADQLMLPMGIAAAKGESSEFLTVPLSMHSQTHLDILKRFLPIRTQITIDSDVEQARVKILAAT